VSHSGPLPTDDALWDGSGAAVTLPGELASAPPNNLLVFVAFAGDPLHAVGGFVQRALLAVAFGWITLTGWRLLLRTS
jgi:hypothetical protein